MMLRHPRRALLVAALVIVVLVAFGTSLEDRLSPSTLEIRGTTADTANDMLSEYFGDSAPFVDPAAGRPGGDRPPGPGTDPHACAATQR